jgi:hypothetical protein
MNLLRKYFNNLPTGKWKEDFSESAQEELQRYYSSPFSQRDRKWAITKSNRELEED